MKTIDDFRNDIESDYCPIWVPQDVKDAVWDKAWELGHSWDPNEVAHVYDELMDIVRLFKENYNEQLQLRL